MLKVPQLKPTFRFDLKIPRKVCRFFIDDLASHSPRKVVAEIGMQIESSAKAVAKLTDIDYESASENDIESDADAPLLLDKIPRHFEIMCACVCPITAISQE